MEKEYPATVKILHYHCDKCDSIMQYTGEEMFSKFKHVCTNKQCNEMKLLEKIFPFTVVDLLVQKETKPKKENGKIANKNEQTPAMRKV